LQEEKEKKEKEKKGGNINSKLQKTVKNGRFRTKTKGVVSRKNKHKNKKRNMTKHTGKQTKYKKSNTYRK
jgi:hypothetical protein